MSSLDGTLSFFDGKTVRHKFNDTVTHFPTEIVGDEGNVYNPLQTCTTGTVNIDNKCVCANTPSSAPFLNEPLSNLTAMYQSLGGDNSTTMLTPVAQSLIKQHGRPSGNPEYRAFLGACDK